MTVYTSSPDSLGLVTKLIASHAVLSQAINHYCVLPLYDFGLEGPFLAGSSQKVRCAAVGLNFGLSYLTGGSPCMEVVGNGMRQCWRLQRELVRYADAGTLLPFRREDRTRLTWWTNWFNFWGGVLFCVG